MLSCFSNTLLQTVGGQARGPLSLFLPAVESSIIFPLFSLAPRELWTEAATKTGLKLGRSQARPGSELGGRLPAPNKADTPTLKKMGEKQAGKESLINKLTNIQVGVGHCREEINKDEKRPVGGLECQTPESLTSCRPEGTG